MGITNQLTAAAIGAGLGGVVAGAHGALRGASWRRAGVRAVALAALISIGPGALAVAGSPFPILATAHLLYLVLVITVPLLAVGALAVHMALRGDRRLLPPAVVASSALVALAIPMVGVYATHVEPYRLRVDRVTIASALLDAPVRVGVIADIQTGRITDYERDAVARLLAERPDVVVIAGDLHQGSPASLAATLADFRALLTELATVPAGAFVVSGDSEDPGELELLVTGTGVTILDGRVERLDVRGQPVVLGGVDTDERSAAARSVYARLGDLEGTGFRLLVAHRPDAVLAVGRCDVDLVVAGHTHGGQVAIPWFGPPIVRSAVPRSVGRGGLGAVADVPIYVSTGVGVTRADAPQVRFLVRPSVGVIDIVPDDASSATQGSRRCG